MLMVTKRHGDELGEEENFKGKKYDDIEYDEQDKFCVYKY